MGVFFILAIVTLKLKCLKINLLLIQQGIMEELSIVLIQNNFK